MFEMGFEGLFVRFWWLIFPIFGMLMAFWGVAQSDRRSKRAMDVIKTYVEQGKEPPAELMDIASGDHPRGANPYQRRSPAGRFVTFTALAIAAALASQLLHTDRETSNLMLIGAAFFGVLALGSFLMAFFGPRPEK